MIQHLLLPLVLAQASNGAGAAASAPATQPAPSTPTFLQQIATWFGPTFESTPMSGWIQLLAGIFVGLLAAKIAQTILKNTGAKLKSRGWHSRGAVFIHAARPAALAVFALSLRIGLQGIYFQPREITAGAKTTLENNPLPDKLLGLLMAISVAWFLYNLVDLVVVALRKLTADETIAVLVRKTLRIFILIIFALFVVQNTFGQEVTPWLAGLGLAGLAVSLAAPGAIKNIFG